MLQFQVFMRNRYNYLVQIKEKVILHITSNKT